VVVCRSAPPNAEQAPQQNAAATAGGSEQAGAGATVTLTQPAEATRPAEADATALASPAASQPNAGDRESHCEVCDEPQAPATTTAEPTDATQESEAQTSSRAGMLARAWQWWQQRRTFATQAEAGSVVNGAEAEDAEEEPMNDTLASLNRLLDGPAPDALAAARPEGQRPVRV
jgi:hypothetical protein